MRRLFTVVLVAFSLIVLAIPPAAANFTYNSQNSEKVVEGGWWGEWGAEVVSSGMASARLPKGAKVGEIYYSDSHGELVWCEANPDNPEGFWGYVWTQREGWGPASVTIGKGYSSGTASAMVDVWTWTYSDCDWWGGEEAVSPENGGEPMETVDVTVAMVATGRRAQQSDSYSFHMPGQYNEHSRSRSTYREAAGVVTVDGDSHDTSWGQIGEYSWRVHSNGK